jgi:carboxypeptidase C (cathepsin A)
MADAPQPDSDPKESDKKMRERVDKLVAQAASQSSGCITLGARALDYSVNAAFVPVVDEGFDGVLGEPQAAVMATSYVLKGAVPHARPVCFAFNGGPGSAPVWPHLGALGPKRVVMPYDARMPTAPFAMADNPHSWFEHFDLVFIDPPHTGWSTTASLDARKKLLSVDGDVAALTEVMRIWLTRWSSPVCTAGESYGTMRGAALADKLQSSGVALCGLILISCAMDLRSIVFAPTNDLPYSLFLPAFANVSQYHGLLKGSLAKSPVAAPTVAETFASKRAIRVRWRRAALASGSSIQASKPSRPRTRWRRWHTSVNSSA